MNNRAEDNRSCDGAVHGDVFYNRYGIGQLSVSIPYTQDSAPQFTDFNNNVAPLTNFGAFSTNIQSQDNARSDSGMQGMNGGTTHAEYSSAQYDHCAYNTVTPQQDIFTDYNNVTVPSSSSTPDWDCYASNTAAWTQQNIYIPPYNNATISSSLTSDYNYPTSNTIAWSQQDIYSPTSSNTTVSSSPTSDFGEYSFHRDGNTPIAQWVAQTSLFFNNAPTNAHPEPGFYTGQSIPPADEGRREVAQLMVQQANSNERGGDSVSENFTCE